MQLLVLMSMAAAQDYPDAAVVLIQTEAHTHAVPARAGAAVIGSEVPHLRVVSADPDELVVRMRGSGRTTIARGDTLTLNATQVSYVDVDRLVWSSGETAEQWHTPAIAGVPALNKTSGGQDKRILVRSEPLTIGDVVRVGVKASDQGSSADSLVVDASVGAVIVEVPRSGNPVAVECDGCGNLTVAFVGHPRPPE